MEKSSPREYTGQGSRMEEEPYCCINGDGNRRGDIPRGPAEPETSKVILIFKLIDKQVSSNTLYAA